MNQKASPFSRKSDRVVIGKQHFFLPDIPTRSLSEKERLFLKMAGVPIRNKGIVAMGSKMHARVLKAGMDCPPVFRVVSAMPKHRERTQKGPRNKRDQY